mmetsp:Transcript_17185/g.19815  ORF Transcript_17185/g.19815 Transcript_17185/m.19815 type:complete len:81 (+) Transcript_17185:125-367(+)
MLKMMMENNPRQMPRYYYYGVAVAVLLSGVFILRESLWTPPSPVAYKQDPMSSVLDGVVKGNNNDSNNNREWMMLQWRID